MRLILFLALVASATAFVVEKPKFIPSDLNLEEIKSRSVRLPEQVLPHVENVPDFNNMIYEKTMPDISPEIVPESVVNALKPVELKSVNPDIVEAVNVVENSANEPETTHFNQAALDSIYKDFMPIPVNKESTNDAAYVQPIESQSPTKHEVDNVADVVPNALQDMQPIEIPPPPKPKVAQIAPPENIPQYNAFSPIALDQANPDVNNLVINEEIMMLNELVSQFGNIYREPSSVVVIALGEPELIKKVSVMDAIAPEVFDNKVNVVDQPIETQNSNSVNEVPENYRVNVVEQADPVMQSSDAQNFGANVVDVLVNNKNENSDSESSMQIAPSELEVVRVVDTPEMYQPNYPGREYDNPLLR